MSEAIKTVVAHLSIAEVAIVFVEFKREAERLRQLRVTTYCDRAEPNGGTGLVDRSQEEPCWKGREDRGEDRRLLVAPENWCDGCKKRQEIHEHYRAVVKKRGVAMTTLMRRVGKVSKPPAPKEATVVMAGPQPVPVDQRTAAEVFIDDDMPW